jgi:hypothetical protein
MNCTFCSYHNKFQVSLLIHFLWLTIGHTEGKKEFPIGDDECKYSKK